MSIASRINAIEEHIGNAYEKLEDLGIDLTNTDKNIDNIASKLDEIYEDYPKITATDTEASLNNTKAGRMDVGLKGNTAQATSILPTGYTQLDYIESTGTQSIGTSISGSGTWKLKIQGTSNTGSTQIVLGRASGRGHWFGISSGGKYTLGGGVDTTKNYNELIEANVTITDTGISLTIGNETVTRTNEYSVTSSYNLIGLDSYLSHIKMYRASFYQNNVLKNDLIPCKNSSNVVGMYDIVTNTFYQNAGTGTFTAGNAVTIPNPDYPQEIQNVSGSNTIKVQNKNLLDFDDFLTTGGATYTKSDGVYTITDRGNIVSNRYTLKVIAGNTYTLSCAKQEQTSTNVRVQLYKDGTFLGTAYATGTEASSATFTAEAGSVYTINLTYSTLGTNIMYKNPMLELGSTATDYVSHEEQNLPVNLGEYELCKIGTAQDYFYKESGKWYLHKEIGDETLDGTNQKITNIGTASNLYYVLYPVPSGENAIQNSNILSNRFIQGYLSLGKFYVTTATGVVFAFVHTDQTLDTVAKWNTWLQSNNTRIQYQLATPTNTEITETSLINELEAILQARSYNNQTNISQTNEDLPFILDIKALRGE